MSRKKRKAIFGEPERRPDVPTPHLDAGLDVDRIILIAYEEENGVNVRHNPNLRPEVIIGLGESLIRIGKRLQQ